MARVQWDAISRTPMSHDGLVTAAVGASVASGGLLRMMLVAVGAKSGRVQRVATGSDGLNVVNVGCREATPGDRTHWIGQQKGRSGFAPSGRLIEAIAGHRHETPSCRFDSGFVSGVSTVIAALSPHPLIMHRQRIQPRHQRRPQRRVRPPAVPLDLGHGTAKDDHMPHHHTRLQRQSL